MSIVLYAIGREKKTRRISASRRNLENIEKDLEIRALERRRLDKKLYR
jgi:hypothetical protein